MKISMAFCLCFIGIVQSFAQTGTLQVYCEKDASIYINDQFKGKTKTEMSGLLIENLEAGEISVRVYKPGYVSETKFVIIESGKISECSFVLATQEKEKWLVGLNLHYGSFGLFNVNSVFTKAKYSVGATPFLDYKLHPNFSTGLEIMTMFGKPSTSDDARLMMQSNLRLKALFQPFDKIGFNILVASGFTLWPGRKDSPSITPTFNQTRFGWDFRAAAGAQFSVGKMTCVEVNFGYWASSSTSDNLVWITHDSMIISAGPIWNF